MRTIYVVLFVVALGTAALMVGLSGYEEAVNRDVTSDLDSADALNESAADAPAGHDGNFTGSASSANDGDIVGLILSAITAIVEYVGFVLLLPWELMDLGFPYWFAFPIGLSAQIIASVGLVQFAANRIWR